MPTQYHQFGGREPNIDWYGANGHTGYQDFHALAEAIAGSASPLRKGDKSAPVEVVLGTKLHGSIHLLLTKDERWMMEKALRVSSSRHAWNRPPLYASDFESLSPIYFASTEELKKKLAALKPKTKQKDDSKANNLYREGGHNPYRGAFEHGRVIYRVLNQSIDPAKYSLDNLSWTRGLRVCSFVFNTKGIDDRPSTEKLRNPFVLDVGFCEAQLPSMTVDYTKAKHIVNYGNRTLAAKKPKQKFSHGSENVNAADMPARIQELFKDSISPTDKPMILLVYHEEMTMNYLRNIGVDTTRWRDLLKDLIMPENASRARSNTAGSASSRHSRSRSPRGRQSNEYSRYPHTQGSASSSSATHTSLYPPVFILDLKELFIKLMRNSQIEDVNDIGRALLFEVSNYSCAGDEAALAIDIWRSMVSGPSLDEQHEERSAALASSPQSQQASAPGPSAAQAASSSAAMGSDDEQDPNDVSTNPQTAPTKSSNDNPLDLDVSDWGDSDEDSD